MSAFAGMLVFDQCDDHTVLVERMMRTLAHPAAEPARLWNSRDISLGHCMLRTTASGVATAQPLVRSNPDLTLVMVGRIDNRETLLSRLASGIHGAVATDEELVMEAYRRWGEDCPGQLLGEFAFALWDASRRQLFCARDAIGAKILAYVQGRGFFAFASKPDALLQIPGVTAAPNDDYVACLLVPEWENRDDRRAWLRDVSGLMEGESMTVGCDRRVHINRYWSAEPAAEDRYASENEAGERFREVFEQAVRDRMRATDETAILLSGGLDSASTALVARRLGNGNGSRPAYAYSVVDDEPQSCAESRSILQLIAALDLRGILLSVPSLAGPVTFSDLVDIACKEAHPIDNSILLPCVLALAACRNGHRVLLHGACGDLAMNAPDYYAAALVRAGRLRQAWKECRAASRNHLYLRGMPASRIFRRNVYQALVPPAVIGWRSRYGRSRNPSPVDNGLINPAFAARLGLHERLRQQVETERRAFVEDQRLAGYRNNLAMIRSTLGGMGRIGARFGIEMRDPWADQRVLELLSGLPLRYKVSGGWIKQPARTFVGCGLPASVRWRRDKTHLGWKLTHRLMRDTEAQVRALIAGSMPFLEQYVNAEAVRGLLDGREGPAGRDATQVLFDLVTLVRWQARINSLSWTGAPSRATA